MGIKNVIVAINKMDLVDYKKDIFENIVEQYKDLIAKKLDFQKCTLFRFSPSGRQYCKKIKGNGLV